LILWSKSAVHLVTGKVKGRVKFASAAGTTLADAL